MYEVVHELVYFPHDVFVPRTTTLSCFTISPLLTLMHFFTPLYLKLVLHAWNNLPDYILMLILCLYSSQSLSSYMYCANSQ